MASEQGREIQTVAVIGCGVIGASWVALFLSKGLKVLVVDPAPSARTNLEQCLTDVLPVLQISGGVEQASTGTYEFVEDIAARLPEADFIQEVLRGPTVRTSFPPHRIPLTDHDAFYRMDLSAWISKENLWRLSTGMQDPASRSSHRRPAYRARPTSNNVKTADVFSWVIHSIPHTSFLW